ncbi:MAG: hypothetical protein J6X18_11625 [Bacteroidales bacterium]|nr:hypothetical protein [Bacteroidales bacterium]
MANIITTNVRGNIGSNSNIPNLDAKYGPYNTKTEAWNNFVVGSSVNAANGLTVGVYEGSGANIKVVEYVFQGLVDGTTPNINTNLVPKKPELATVATTGNYNDLTNKPDLKTVATTGAYSDLTGTPNLTNAVYWETIPQTPRNVDNNNEEPENGVEEPNIEENN